MSDGHQVVTLADGVQCDMDELSRGASKAMLGVVKERQMNRRALSWT